MSQKELVSIIMPNYNCEKFVLQTITSVINQTYDNWELLFVDDCSTDKSVEIVESFNDSRIRILKNSQNSGAAISRNYALREAKGKWIAFLDSDDLWHKEKLEKQINFMKKNGYAFSYTYYSIISPNGIKSPYVYTGPKKVTRRKLFNYCYYSTITVMYEREVVGLVQIEDVKKNNDYALWFEVSKKADCYCFPENLSTYCKRDQSISSGSKLKLIKYHYIMFRKALKKGRIVSFLLTLNNLFFGLLKKIFYKKLLEEK